MGVASALGELVLGLGLMAEPVGAIEGEVMAVEPETRVPELVSEAAEAVVLTWEAPAGCPDASAVRRALAGYLGEGPTAEAGAAVRAVARVTESSGGYRLELRTETASGVTTRETASSDCAVLVDATAVILAIAVDPATILGRGAAAPRPQAMPPQESPPAPVPPEEPVAPAEPTVEREGDPPPSSGGVSDAAAAPPRVRFAMRAGGGLDVGVLPGPTGGLRLAGAVFGRRWRAELRGDLWFPRTAIVEDGIGGRIGLWSLGGRGCGVLGVTRLALEFPLCAGIEAGVMRGDPVGERVANAETARRPWLAADGSAGLAWVPRRFLALVVQAELVVPILRTGFRVGDLEVHRAGPVAGRGLVGLEARFP
jgi:hypothetical protein